MGMFSMRSFLFSTVLLTAPLSLLISVPAQAQTMAAAPADPASASTPAQFIQTLANAALSSISGKQLSDEETTARFRTLLRENFDLKSIGRFALGPYFNTATPAQREAYQAAFENMIVDSYAIRFRDYTGGSLKTGREMQQGNDTLVDSQIVQTDGAPPIGVTWRVRKEAAGMKIVDVAVEGVSMSQTERSEFSSVIEQHGGQVQPLIDALQNHQVGLAKPDSQ
jgi:phospholipid transport system substrate-binding protein